MKSNKVIAVFMLFACCLTAFAQRVDTLYYDNEWKGVESKQFASYIRYASYAADANYKNRFRDYYATGELQAEGEFVTIDKYDDKNSVLGPCKSYYKNGKMKVFSDVRDGNGKITKYYENGNKKEEFEVVNGVVSGPYTTYYENGLIEEKGNIVDEKVDGLFYQFSMTGDTCLQIEYDKGEYAKPYYTYSTIGGFVTKYKVSDNSLFLEIPSMNDMQVYQQDGTSWYYYAKNGLCLMVSGSINRDYGKYFTLDIVLTNNSMEPFVFDPSLITAYKTHKGRTEALHVLDASEYMGRVGRRQAFLSGLNAWAEETAAAKAGYSASSTQVNSSYAGASVSGAVGAAVGTYGSAVGAAVGGSVYAGASSTSSTTVNYDGAAAYQAQLIAQARSAEYNNQLVREYNMKNEGYLKATTVYPGETITGNINVEYEKGAEASFNISINSVSYPFSWTY